jgi:hypothetical protein
MAVGDGSAEETEVSPLWLSHHRPEHYDRCVRLGSVRVCRRCLVLYPVAFAVTALALAGAWWSDDLDPYLVVLLPLPAVVEFCLEQLGYVRYNRVRQMIFTLLFALALGAGFARYLENPTDLLFWATFGTYATVSVGTALWRVLDDGAM